MALSVDPSLDGQPEVSQATRWERLVHVKPPGGSGDEAEATPDDGSARTGPRGRGSPDSPCSARVIVPELALRHWCQRLLYEDTATRLRGSLAALPKVLVTSVPLHV